jgi:hypothetical protein
MQEKEKNTVRFEEGAIWIVPLFFLLSALGNGWLALRNWSSGNWAGVILDGLFALLGLLFLGMYLMQSFRRSRN